jgi:endo-1,3-1,4-beta-glycanase ExoK
VTPYGDNRVPPPGPDRQIWPVKPTRSKATSSPESRAEPGPAEPSEQPTQWTPTVPAPQPPQAAPVSPHAPLPPRASRPAPPSVEPFATAPGRSRRGPLLLAAGLVAALLVGTFVVVMLLRPDKRDAASAGGTSGPTATTDAGALAGGEQAVAGMGASPSASPSPSGSSGARPATKASPSPAKTMPTRDDFTAATLDTTMWTIYGAPFSSDMVRVSGGELQLLGVGQDPTGAANKSGGMCWCPNSNHRYGVWQLRARFDAGAGYRPVIQLWPQSNNSTTDGAIDFANDGDAARTTLGFALHPAGGGAAATGTVKGDFTAWHVYRVEWRATFVRMYLDGTIIFDSSTSTTPLTIPSAPMHLTIQEDKGPGGGIPTPNAQTPVPVILHVDWVSYDA